MTPLEESIEVWKRRAAGERIPPSPSLCPLCTEFFRNKCVGCPVADAGHLFCDDTPYDDYADLYDDWKNNLSKHGPDSNKLKKAAKKEVEFLEGLRA